MKTRKELEAAKAAALAEVAAIDAKIAALDEPDWGPAAKAFWQGAYPGHQDMHPKTEAEVIRGLIAAAPLMPVTAMTEAEIEELAGDMVEKHVTGSDNFCEQSREFAELTIRATIARLGPVRKDWPSEAELRGMAQGCVRDHVSRRHEAIEDYGGAIALEMARRLREFGA